MARVRHALSALADTVYLAVLRALPEPIRGPFGQDMAQMFRDRRREARGRPLILTWLWVTAIRDVVAEALRARMTHERGIVSGIGSAAGSVVQDLRFGARLLWRDRAFTAVALLVLAIGIGANSAAFGLVNALLLKPRPGHPAGAVVGLYNKDTSKPGTFRAFSYPEFVDLSARHDVFAALSAQSFAFVGVTEGDSTRQVIVDMVTRGFFDVFGAPPVRGRTFTPEEERVGSGASVAILSYSAWQRHGGQPDVLGSTVRVNGRALTVVGVAQQGFGGSLAFITPEMWVPISEYDRLANDFIREGMTTTLGDRRTRTLIIDAQLLPGVTIAQAAPALDALSAELVAADPAGNVHQQLMIAPLARMAVTTSPHTDADLTGVAVALLSLSGIVLLIASLNLANMLLARGAARQKEFAIRLAIGGGRGRLVRQLLTEGALLSVLGGGLGLVVASWSTWALVAGLAPFIPVSMMMDPVPDGRVLAVTFSVSVLSALIFSVGPAWRLARADAMPELKSHAGELHGRSRFGARHLLVTVQLALSLVMLTAAGLFVRSSLEAASADPGFTLDHGIVVQVDASLAGRSIVETTAIYQRALERLRARPDVRSASLASNMPFTGFSDQQPVQRAGALLPVGDPGRVWAELVSIGADYFRTLDLHVTRGREFTLAEEMSATLGRRGAVIDEPLSKKLFGTGNPLGQSLQYTKVSGQPPVVLDIVGVVPGVSSELFDEGPVPHVYVAYAGDPRANMYFHVRTMASTAEADAALLPAMRSEFRATDAELPVLAIGTRAMFRDRGIILAVVRTGSRVFAVFGLAALVLAAVGVYGVKAFVVSRRTHEIGIRVALGATRSGVVWLIAREGLRVTIVGLGIGAALSVLAGIGLQSMTYQRHGPDATTLVLPFGVLLVVSILAGAMPARRATRIQPITALRAD
jgi:putative ABC transport system permease protein